MWRAGVADVEALQKTHSRSNFNVFLTFFFQFSLYFCCTGPQSGIIQAVRQDKSGRRMQHAGRSDIRQCGV